MVDMVFLLPVGQVAPIAALTAIGQATAGRPHLRPQRSGGPASDKNLSARRRHAGDIVGASGCGHEPEAQRSEEQTSELQSIMRISYDVFCLKKKTAE